MKKNHGTFIAIKHTKPQPTIIIQAEQYNIIINKIILYEREKKRRVFESATLYEVRY